MKKRAGLLSALLVLGLTLAACSNEEEDNHKDMEHSSSDEIRSLEVDLQAPEQIEAGNAVEFTAHVTSNDEDVTDADQVMFEVLEGEESLETIVTEHAENGEYILEYTFDNPGEYTVIAHVDAYQLHTMPEETVTVE